MQNLSQERKNLESIIIATAGFYVNIDLSLFLDDVRGGYTADVAVLVPHSPPVLVVLLFP